MHIVIAIAVGRCNKEIDMFKIAWILSCLLFMSVSSAFSQKDLTYSQVDSIVDLTNSSGSFVNVIDTGRIEQGEIVGRYRDCYIVDTLTKELKAFVGSMTLNDTHNATVTAYYFHKSRLIKLELFDIRTDHKRYNSTYLYYINEENEEGDELQSKNLKKLKYLKLSAGYLDNFQKKWMGK